MGPEPELPEPGFGAQALAQEVLGHQSCKVISKGSLQTSNHLMSGNGLHVTHFDSRVS